MISICGTHRRGKCITLTVSEISQERTPRKRHALHFIAPNVPSLVILPGEQLNAWAIAHFFDHLPHLLGLGAVYAFRGIEPRHALLAFPIQQFIRQTLLCPGENAMFRQSPVVLPKALMVFEPCDHRDVLKPPCRMRPPRPEGRRGYGAQIFDFSAPSRAPRSLLTTSSVSGKKLFVVQRYR